MSLNYKITGSAEWLKKLSVVTSTTKQKQILRSAVRAAAKPARQILKTTEPQDTGATSKAITVVVRGKGYSIQAFIGADVDYKKGNKQPSRYDHLTEYGWETPDGRSIPGQHTVQKAAEASQQQALAAGTQKVIDGIIKVLKNG
jgi:hypothetical protein